MKYFTRELWKCSGSAVADEQWNTNCIKYQNYLDSLADRPDIQELLKVLRAYQGFHDYDVEFITVNRKERTVIIALQYDAHTRIVLRYCKVDKFNLAINELIDNPPCMRWGYLELEAHDNGKIGMSVAFDWENEMNIVFEHMEIKEEKI